MKLNRHYVCYDNKKVHRRLFLCHLCNKACIPLNFRKFGKIQHYLIATEYACKSCDVKFRVSSR